MQAFFAAGTRLRQKWQKWSDRKCSSVQCALCCWASAARCTTAHRIWQFSLEQQHHGITLEMHLKVHDMMDKRLKSPNSRIDYINTIRCGFQKKKFTTNFRLFCAAFCSWNISNLDITQTHFDSRWMIFIKINVLNNSSQSTQIYWYL